MAHLNRIKNTIFEILQIAVAVLLASIGLKAFLLPNGFLDGGVTGIAILISEVTSVELSIVLLIVTIPFLILGWFTVSKRILVKSVISVAALAAAIHFENFQSITDDKLIIAIFGGAFLGTGIGLAIKNGAVLDGSEIFGIYVHERFGFSIGNVILAFNVVLFAITAMALSVEAAMYSILTFLVTGKVVDFVMQGFEDYVGLMIVSQNCEDLQEKLIEKIGLGLTIYKGTKGHGTRGSNEDIEIIHTVMNRIDSKRAYNTIEETDPSAFVIEFDVHNVKGGILRKYLSRD